MTIILSLITIYCHTTLLQYYIDYSHHIAPWFTYFITRSLPCGSVGKESACNAGDPGSIPGSGRCPGEVIGSPLLDSCLENSVGRGARWSTVHGITESDVIERLTLAPLNTLYLFCSVDHTPLVCKFVLSLYETALAFILFVFLFRFHI